MKKPKSLTNTPVNGTFDPGGALMVLGREYYEHFSKTRYYGVFLALIAFVLMVTGLIPFEVVLIPCVAAAPERWRKIAVRGVIGSALGAMLLAALFQVYGRSLMEHFFPMIQSSKGWLQAESWIDNSGVFALTGIAALPIAQLPAIAFCGLMKMNLFEVCIALLVGKSVKYGAIAYATSKGELKLRSLRK